MTTATYAVSGMTCDHCVKAITGELTKIEGVTAVDVDLPTGKVTVSSEQPVDDGAVRAAVDEAGVELTG